MSGYYALQECLCHLYFSFLIIKGSNATFLILAKTHHRCVCKRTKFLTKNPLFLSSLLFYFLSPVKPFSRLSSLFGKTIFQIIFSLRSNHFLDYLLSSVKPFSRLSSLFDQTVFQIIFSLRSTHFLDYILSSVNPFS